MSIEIYYDYTYYIDKTIILEVNSTGEASAIRLSKIGGSAERSTDRNVQEELPRRSLGC